MDNYRREMNSTKNFDNNEEKSHEKLPFIERLKRKLQLLDYPILIIMTILIIISLIMVFSSTMYLSEDGISAPDPFGYMMTQFFAVIVGFVGIIVMISINYKMYRNIIFLNSVMTVLIGFLFLLIFRGVIGGGAQSWFSLGFASFQPSELVKLLSVLVLARLLENQQREVILAYEEFSDKTSKYSILLLSASIILILLQPDLGMVILIVGTLFIMMVQQNLSFKINLAMYSGAFIAVIGVNIFSRLASDWLVSVDSYQINRLGSFSNPFKYPQHDGYQLISGYLAFSRGGWLGLGIGQGETKRYSLPAGHTDFILANIGEETGLIGIALILGLLFSLIFMIYRWAVMSKSHFRRNVLFGMATMLLIQSFINIGGVAGIIPLTGVTLPFISYGGSSMLISIMAIAVVQVMIIEEKKQVIIIQAETEKKLNDAMLNEDGFYKRDHGLKLVHSRKQEK